MLDMRLVKSFEYWKKAHRGMQKGIVAISRKHREHYVISLSDEKRREEYIPMKKSFQKAAHEATREQAKMLMQKAVSEGRVSLQTAGIIEERLNNGKITPAKICKALSEPLRKSQGEPTKEDAIAALQHALDAKIITMQEWQKTFDELKTAKLAPTQVIAACKKREDLQAVKEKPMQKSLPQSANYNGYSFDQIEARNELLKEYPLGQLLGI